MKRTKMARSHNNDNDNDDHLDERAPLLGGGGGSNRPTIDGFDTISTNNHNNNNHCGHDDDDDDRRRREEDDDDNKSPTVADSPTTVNGNEEEEQESPTRDVAPPPPPPTSAPSTPPPVPQAVVKADMEMAWSEPAGLRVRRQNDENLIIFRRAVGINSELNSGADARSLEEGRRHAAGIYAATLQAQRSKALMYTLIRTYIPNFLPFPFFFWVFPPGFPVGNGVNWKGREEREDREAGVDKGVWKAPPFCSALWRETLHLSVLSMPKC